jgi:hypothetical protein
MFQSECWLPTPKLALKKSVGERYGLDGEFDEMIFTLYNPTTTGVYFDLFKPFEAQQVNIPNSPYGYIQPPITFPTPALTPLPPPVTPVFWIDGSEDYNETVRDLVYSPAWVRRIYIYSQSQSNFNQVINHLYKDANGNRRIVPRFPSLSVGINQFQGWIGQLNFDDDDRVECVLGINQWFRQVYIAPNSDITFLLIYNQIDKSKILSDSPCFNNTCTNKLRKWSERDLKLYDTTWGSPYKQNMMGAGVVIKPFSFSMLKKYST